MTNFGRKNFVTYTVLVAVGDQDAVAVRRRFSDFEKLYKSFAARFGSTGMVVPTLPPKKGWGTSPDVVAERVLFQRKQPRPPGIAASP